MMKTIVSQFSHPRGFVGSLVGMLMVRTNRKRNEWAVSLLGIRPTDHILEIGFGPGVAIKRMAALSTKGQVAGIDVSQTMVQQASKRNAEGIREGFVTLQHGSVEMLPYSDETFDKVFSSNSVQFWPDTVNSMKEVRRVMKPGGIFSIVLQPRWVSTDDEVREVARNVMVELKQAGFRVDRVEYKSMRPMMVFCVLARKPENDEGT